MLALRSTQVLITALVHGGDVRRLSSISQRNGCVSVIDVREDDGASVVRCLDVV